MKVQCVHVCSTSAHLGNLAISVGGADAVSILSEMVTEYNVRKRLNIDEETWPPYWSKKFIPLVLIHHHGQHNIKQATAVAQLIQTGDIENITLLSTNQSASKHDPKLDSCESLQKVLDSSTVTNELAEILALLEQSKDPQFILIEGAPGMGKSILLKEIAFRWGNKQFLQNFKLVLLICLRNPVVQQALSIEDLLYLCVYKVDKKVDIETTQIVSTCSRCIMQNGGKDLVFLFDGYDEILGPRKKNGLIADILNREVLPSCALVVSSRPHATVYLREQATIRVSILGFTETE